MAVGSALLCLAPHVDEGITPDVVVLADEESTALTPCMWYGSICPEKHRARRSPHGDRRHRLVMVCSRVSEPVLRSPPPLRH